MTVRAVIDIGTNSVKLLVAEVGRGRFETIDERVLVTRLGEGIVETGDIGDEAEVRTLDALRALAATAAAHGAEDLVAVGTMGLRTARNAPAFLDHAGASSGLRIEVLSGEEEARLSYAAAVYGREHPSGPVTVFDIGGGSLEIVHAEDGEVRSWVSLPLGVRFLTDRFFRTDPVDPASLRSLMLHVESDLHGLPERIGALVGSGGTATTLAAVALRLETYDPARADGVEVPLEEIRRQVDLFLALSLRERRGVPGLLPERADVILAGAALVQALLERTGCPAFTACARGLRHGVLIDRFVGR